MIHEISPDTTNEARGTTATATAAAATTTADRLTHPRPNPEGHPRRAAAEGGNGPTLFGDRDRADYGFDRRAPPTGNDGYGDQSKRARRDSPPRDRYDGDRGYGAYDRDRGYDDRRGPPRSPPQRLQVRSAAPVFRRPRRRRLRRRLRRSRAAAVLLRPRTRTRRGLSPAAQGPRRLTRPRGRARRAIRPRPGRTPDGGPGGGRQDRHRLARQRHQGAPRPNRRARHDLQTPAGRQGERVQAGDDPRVQAIRRPRHRRTSPSRPRLRRRRRRRQGPKAARPQATEAATADAAASTTGTAGTIAAGVTTVTRIAARPPAAAADSTIDEDLSLRGIHPAHPATPPSLSRKTRRARSRTAGSSSAKAARSSSASSKRRACASAAKATNPSS